MCAEEKIFFGIRDCSLQACGSAMQETVLNWFNRQLCGRLILAWSVYNQVDLTATAPEKETKAQPKPLATTKSAGGQPKTTSSTRPLVTTRSSLPTTTSYVSFEGWSSMEPEPIVTYNGVH
jgi:hypothetical protein